MTDSERPEAASTHVDPPLPPGEQRMIGRYRLERVLATGGMGTIYLAVQDRPHRAVALKLLTRGVASAAALRRFESEAQILPTWTQKGFMAAFIAILFLMPFDLPVISQIPFVRFLGDGDWLRIVTTVMIFVIAALGLNILSGVAGQVSLGHAFFMGVGASTGAFLGGSPGSNTWGLELPMWIWLPGAGVAAVLALDLLQRGHHGRGRFSTS